MSKKVVAVWDKENCDVTYRSISDLFVNINIALKKRDPNFELCQLIAVGPLSRMPPNLDPAMVKYISLPKYNIPCQAVETCGCCFIYIVKDDNSNLEKFERTTDIADVIVVMEVFKHVYQNDTKNLLIIGGDADFGCCLRTFAKDHDFNMMLAYPKEGSNEIKNVANNSWMWTSDARDDKKLMINGGGPIN